MVVFVPTRSRIYKQITRREFFLDDIPYPVYYVVPESEREPFLKAWPKSSVLTVPDSFRLSDIRQWLIDKHTEPDPWHCCFDDDLVFLRRKAPLDVHQRKGSKQDAIEAFDRIRDWLYDGYVHGALSQRGGNNHCPEAYKLVGRATDTHFYRADVIRAEGIRFDATILRQDFHVTLSLLELGYPNILDHEFMSGQKDGEPGGCQVYRTHAMLEEQAQLLASLHPEFVKVVTKERIGGFGVSTDVRISWLKAYGSRVKDRKLPPEAANDLKLVWYDLPVNQFKGV